MKLRNLAMMSLLVSLLLIAGACAGETETAVEQPSEAVELSPEELGELGVELESNPEQIEDILAERGMTLETYEAAIRRVTENPGEAKRYAEAYRNASG